jgi:hypothetical protein
VLVLEREKNRLRILDKNMIEQDLTKIVNENYSKLEKSTKGIREFGHNAFVIGGALNIFPYVIIPSVIRTANEPPRFSSNKKEISYSEGVGIAGGVISGILGIIYQTSFYIDNPKYLLALGVTNVALGAYELQKAFKKRKIEESLE